MNINMNILTCPDFEDIEKLLRGELSQKKRTEVSEHIEKCPDCKEIYETLKELGVEQVQEASERINEKIDKRAQSVSPKKKNTKVFSLFKYAAAAAVVGIAYLGIKNLKSDPETTFSGTVAVNDDEPNTSTPTQEIVAEEEPKTLQVNEDEVITSSPSKENTIEKKEIKEKKTPEKPKTQTPAIEKEEITRGGNVVPVTRTLQDGNVDTAKINSKMAKAIKLMQQEEYFDAKEYLEDIINLIPQDHKALKNLAICNFKLKYYRQAVSIFKKLKPKNEEEKLEIEKYIEECTQNL